MFCFVSVLFCINLSLHVQIEIFRLFCVCATRAADMSALLFAVGELDERFVRALLVLKELCRCQSLTVDMPSPQFSSFMLTMMLVHYLQSTGAAPAFRHLLNTHAHTTRPLCSAHHLAALRRRLRTDTDTERTNSLRTFLPCLYLCRWTFISLLVVLLSRRSGSILLQFFM